MSIFEHQRIEIWNQVQHPYKHTLTDFAYANSALPGVTNTQSAMDWIIGVLYPNQKASVATPAALPASGNTLYDYRVVLNDGDGKSSAYRWEQREGDSVAKWYKIYDMDFGAGSILASAIESYQDLFVQKFGNDDRDSAGAVVTDAILAGQHIWGGKTASYNLTLHANMGDGTGAQTGFIQFADQIRPTSDDALDLGTASLRMRKSFWGSGAVGAPSIAIGGATSGIYSSGTNKLSFSSNGTLALDFDANQNFILGSSNSTIGLINGRVKVQSGSAVYALLLGADFGANTLTNNTIKEGLLAVPNYANGSPGATAFLMQNGVSTNSLYIGGGSSGATAATDVHFYLGSSISATAGSEVGSIAALGNWTLGLAGTSTIHTINTGDAGSNGTSINLNAGGAGTVFGFTRSATNGVTIVSGGSSISSGGRISLFGSTHSTAASVYSMSDATGVNIRGNSDGTITFGNDSTTVDTFYGGSAGVFGSSLSLKVSTASGGTDSAGIFTLARSVTDGSLAFTGSSAGSTGGVIQLFGNTHATRANVIALSQGGTNVAQFSSGNFQILQAGNGLQVKEGSNAKQGTAALAIGVAVVSNTSVTASSRIMLTSQVDGGTPGFVRVSSRIAGTSFTITSSNALDTSTIAYEIFEPS